MNFNKAILVSVLLTKSSRQSLKDNTKLNKVIEFDISRVATVKLLDCHVVETVRKTITFVKIFSKMDENLNFFNTYNPPLMLPEVLMKMVGPFLRTFFLSF